MDSEVNMYDIQYMDSRFNVFSMLDISLDKVTLTFFFLGGGGRA